MDFGSKLKTLRQTKQWTQPELAEAMGVEQSYLSKLENGKSIPSADTFALFLQVFDVTPAELLAGVDPTYVHNKLSHIPEVSCHLRNVSDQVRNRSRRWLLSSAALCVLGITLGLSAHFNWIFPDTLHAYKSLGVVLPGEPKELFRTQLMRSGAGQAFIEMKQAVEKRLDEDYMVTPIFRGLTFNVPVEGGSRTYHLEHTRHEKPMENRYLLVLAALLTAAGSFGFVLERLWTNAKRSNHVGMS